MFKIGDFSKICRVPVSALRYYADIGLLEPTHIDNFTGYRYYSLDQLPRLNRILALRDLGLSLTQIKQLLDERVTPEQMRGMLRLKQAELQQVVNEEQARLARVAARLKQIEQETSMTEVVLKQIEPMIVLSIREILDDPIKIGTLIGECAQVVTANRVQITATPMTLYHDPEFNPQHMDVEIVFPVSSSAPKSLPLDGGRQMTRRELPALDSAACALHEGGYDSLDVTYTAIGQWIETSRYKIVGPVREIYLRPPQMDDPLTEIQFPVEKT